MKARVSIAERSLKPSDYICWLYYRILRVFSCVLGTVLFRLKSRVFGLRVGKGLRCFGGVHILRAPRSRIDVGRDVCIVSASWRCSSSSLYAKTKLQTWSRTAAIDISDEVSLSGTAITARSRTIRIGAKTMIGPNVVIMDSDFHALWPPETRVMNPAFDCDRDVVIGSNVWIGSKSIILKGVNIGDNSIIAAGSVVTRDIPKNVIAGGVPARVLRCLP
jgi:acetyltransferase-like isoleucine patch superfamily enzyme